MLRKLAFVLVLILTLAGKSPAQIPAPKPTPNAQKVHWHKYVNKEFGFSLMYPDSFRPTTDCPDGNDFRRWLLCLQRRDDADAKLTVTIVIKVPFSIKTNSGGIEHTPQTIGQNLFYCGNGGSMGTGFSDECTFNLKGKSLEFNITPAMTINSAYKTNPLLSKSLKTFRTF